MMIKLVIKKLIKKLYNYNAEKRNKLAPPKEVLQKYGGIVTIENYRKNFITCDKNYRINQYSINATKK